MFRCRVEKRLLKRVHEISRQMGTSTSELVRIFLTALAKTGQMPFTLSADKAEPDLPMRERRNRILRNLHDSEGW